ncbi:acetyl-CoA acetyltransferase [Neobacillus sp.]|uniref:acetyl-CoA acetyltransferase n=1 Tax=Neobacillus sp. TaxID=2675273 RepID=UPI00289A1E57|nr:acetyl-CoA acetyltransferase [Neobacillus sp.]
MSKVYVLGGYQTDFSKNWAREGKDIFDILKCSVEGALQAAKIEPSEVDVCHIGNFIGELGSKQGQLGGLFASIHPAFSGVPASRHEAACASGSIAILAAAAEIEADRYHLACVTGVELLRNVPGEQAANNLGVACWTGREAQDATYPWPYLFNRLIDVYDERYGIRYEHLAEIAKINFENSKLNPNAQTRNWQFNDYSFVENDEHNHVIEGRVRRQDCGQVTDGGATIFLASEKYAKNYAKRHGIPLENIPVIKGWGHKTAPMLLEEKIKESEHQRYVFPHVRQAIEEMFDRAGLSGVSDVDVIETHDCFSITEYMAIDHFGISAPGESWRAIEAGDIAFNGRIPVNPSGGLIGLGHPVGATGIRMVLDAYKQITGTAGSYQVEGVKNVATLNIGGSTTTTVCFVIGV